MTSCGSTNTGVSEEVREATLKIIQRLFKDAKVCSFQQMRQQLRDMALEDSGSARSSEFTRGAVAAANNIDAFPEALQETISKVAVHIHGIYDPVSTPDNKKIDEFRKVIIDLFRAEGPKAKLKMSTMSNAANTMSEAAKLQLAKLKMSTMSQALTSRLSLLTLPQSLTSPQRPPLPVGPSRLHSTTLQFQQPSDTASIADPTPPRRTRTPAPSRTRTPPRRTAQAAIPFVAKALPRKLRGTTMVKLRTQNGEIMMISMSISGALDVLLMFGAYTTARGMAISRLVIRFFWCGLSSVFVLYVYLYKCYSRLFSNTRLILILKGFFRWSLKMNRIVVQV